MGDAGDIADNELSCRKGRGEGEKRMGGSLRELER